MSDSIDTKALSLFVRQPVNQDMIHKLVVTTLRVLPCVDEGKKMTNSGKPLPSLMTFINRLVRYTNVYSGTLMATLAYLERLKAKLPRNAQGLPCTRHRIFLSCLILASKFHNDSSPKNVHWANYTDGLFSLKDVNLMERQLLFLLDWDTRVLSSELILHLGRLLDPYREEVVNTARVRSYLQKQQQQQKQMEEAAKKPAMSRSSSTCSNLSLHSRSSSTLLVASRASSTLSPNWMTSKIDPRIERAAQSEEAQLSRMIANMGVI